MSLGQAWQAPLEEQAKEAFWRACLRAVVAWYRELWLRETLGRLLEAVLMLLIYVCIILFLPVLIPVIAFRRRYYARRKLVERIGTTLESRRSNAIR